MNETKNILPEEFAEQGLTQERVNKRESRRRKIDIVEANKTNQNVMKSRRSSEGQFLDREAQAERTFYFGSFLGSGDLLKVSGQQAVT